MLIKGVAVLLGDEAGPYDCNVHPNHGQADAAQFETSVQPVFAEINAS
jgi:hypothetical protein